MVIVVVLCKCYKNWLPCYFAGSPLLWAVSQCVIRHECAVVFLHNAIAKMPSALPIKL